MFYTSYKIWTTEATAKKNFGIVLLMGILPLLVKPSFLFAFTPVFSALAVSTFGGRSKNFRCALTCALILFLGIFVHCYMRYLRDPSKISFNKNQSGIAIAPFAFWNIYSRDISLDIPPSIAYPLMACVLFGKELFRKKYFWYSLLLFVVACPIGILITETVERSDNGNLFWQVIICNYLMFLCTLKFHLGNVSSFRFRLYKVTTFTILFLSHIVCGYLYICKYFYTASYTSSVKPTFFHQTVHRKEYNDIGCFH